MTKGYPDFGPLQHVFESYKASVRTEPLLAEDALDRMFEEAPARIRLLRRIRMQWAVGITGLTIVTIGLVMELSKPAPAPVNPNIIPAPTHLTKTDSTPAPRAIDTGLQVSDFRLSKYAYDSHLNIDSVVRFDPNLGPDFKEADWNDLLEFCTSPEKVDTLIQTLNFPRLVDHGVPDGNDTTYGGLPDSVSNFYISWRGKRWVMPDSQGYHFFVGRWDHHRPKWWQKYAQIDSDHLDLGAWTGINFRILAVRRKA